MPVVPKVDGRINSLIYSVNSFLNLRVFLPGCLQELVNVIFLVSFHMASLFVLKLTQQNPFNLFYMF